MILRIVINRFLITVSCLYPQLKWVDNHLEVSLVGMDIRMLNHRIELNLDGFIGDGTSRMFTVIDMKPKVLNCPYNTIFKAIERIYVRLVLGDILYANTIAGGIIFEDFVAVLYFSNTYVAQ